MHACVCVCVCVCDDECTVAVVEQCPIHNLVTTVTFMLLCDEGPKHVPATYRSISSLFFRDLCYWFTCQCFLPFPPLPHIHARMRTLAAHPGPGRAVLPAEEGQEESTLAERERPLTEEERGGEGRGGWKDSMWRGEGIEGGVGRSKKM